MIFQSENVPVFSFGVRAKGYIAFGVIAAGILAIGVVSVGFFSVSLIGIGFLAFFGQIGGGFGVGIYQIGLSSYCIASQLSIAIWETRKAQLGYNIIAPLCFP